MLTFNVVRWKVNKLRKTFWKWIAVMRFWANIRSKWSFPGAKFGWRRWMDIGTWLIQTWYIGLQWWIYLYIFNDLLPWKGNHFYLQIPSYFVLANFIPVISNDRALIGWNKYTSCLGLFFLPIICLPHGFKAVSWLIMFLTCWTLSILTFISTHSLRRPNNIWIFALLGLIVSSVFINLLSREIENIIYQYISMQFDVMPDVTALVYFGLGEMLSESIVVRCLQQRKMWDATFGVVMSLVTYAIFLAFPLLFFQGCYNNKCSVSRLLILGRCGNFHEFPTSDNGNIFHGNDYSFHIFSPVHLSTSRFLEWLWVSYFLVILSLGVDCFLCNTSVDDSLWLDTFLRHSS